MEIKFQLTLYPLATPRYSSDPERNAIIYCFKFLSRLAGDKRNAFLIFDVFANGRTALLICHRFDFCPKPHYNPARTIFYRQSSRGELFKTYFLTAEVEAVWRKSGLF